MKTDGNGRENPSTVSVFTFVTPDGNENGKAGNGNGRKKYGIRKRNNSDGNMSVTVGNR